MQIFLPLQVFNKKMFEAPHFLTIGVRPFFSFIPNKRSRLDTHVIFILILFQTYNSTPIPKFKSRWRFSSSKILNDNIARHVIWHKGYQKNRWTNTRDIKDQSWRLEENNIIDLSSLFWWKRIVLITWLESVIPDYININVDM